METICVDIGNSGLRCVRVSAQAPRLRPAADALPWDGDVLRITWPIGTELAFASDPGGGGDGQHAQAYLLHAVKDWLEPSGSDTARAAPRRWIVSSVQRTIATHLRACAERIGASEFHLVTYSDLDLQVAVDQPQRVGVDRLLAAKAALGRSRARHLIVIQAGSAITVDLVQQPNCFRGGAIMPGVPMMLRLLSRGADLLPTVAADELFDLPPLPGTDTIGAMTAGVSSAVVGGVQHLIARYRSQLAADTAVVLSGGDGPRLGPHLGSDVVIVDHLVLRGLAELAAQPGFKAAR